MAHVAHEDTHTATEECPYCGHPITHDELRSIKARIAEEEKQKFELQKKELLKQERAKHLGETSELRKKIAANEANAKQLEIQAREFGKKEAEQKLAADKASLEKKEKAFAANLAQLEADKRTALDRQREVLDAQYEKDLLKQKAESEKINYRLKKQAEHMQRQLEQKSNDELGDGAEVDVFNELKAAFPDDLITRVQKGAAGADIKHEIHINGRNCGLILYDSKNRNQWRNEFVEKLRQDQMSAKADYAVLTTRRFAKDVREMERRDGIVVVNPARVLVVAKMLRDFVEQLSITKLSGEEKQAKRDKLYDFLTSQRCITLFERVEESIAKLDTLDESEQKQQQNTRKKRGELIRAIEKTVLGELEREIEGIIAGTDE
jgi:hypothetical protein